jgi:hypothetical protein
MLRHRGSQVSSGLIIYISMVPSDLGEEIVTARQVVLFTEPDDDAGADTADRYEWQAAMAAADGLALYLDAIEGGSQGVDDSTGIICEHHEDWVVVRAAQAELVSAKHREPSVGVFTTIPQLLGDGGLAHLFGRWHAMSELPYCRLVTTAGLGRGPAQELSEAAQVLRKLANGGQMLLVSGGHEKIIVQFAKGLQQHATGFLPDSWRAAIDGGAADPADGHLEQAGRFLSMLRIDEGKPSRIYVGPAAPDMYCGPVLRVLGHDVLIAASVWEAVLALFRVRMRAAGPKPRGALPIVQAGKPRLTAAALAERGLAARTVTMADIDLTVRKAIANRAGYMPLVPPLRVTRLGIKMEEGLCADNSIERAEQLRSDYQDYWRDRGSGDPLARPAQRRMQRALLRISDDATAAITGQGRNLRGPDLWREIQSRVEMMPAGEWPEDLDAELWLGGLCDLTAQCRVWFSQRFDVEARVRAVKARQEQAS